MSVRFMLNGQEVTLEQFRGDRAESHARFRRMMASGCGPGVMTDAVFLEGHCNGSQFEKTPHVGDVYEKEAAAAGVDVKGKVYMSGLARFPGDPLAWVAGRGDVARICTERGWACDGAVKVAGVRGEPMNVDVADDIIEEEVSSVLAEAASEGVTLQREELKVQVKEKRKPHWCK